MVVLINVWVTSACVHKLLVLLPTQVFFQMPGSESQCQKAFMNDSDSYLAIYVYITMASIYFELVFTVHFKQTVPKMRMSLDKHWGDTLICQNTYPLSCILTLLLCGQLKWSEANNTLKMMKSSLSWQLDLVRIYLADISTRCFSSPWGQMGIFVPEED